MSTQKKKLHSPSKKHAKSFLQPQGKDTTCKHACDAMRTHVLQQTAARRIAQENVNRTTKSVEAAATKLPAQGCTLASPLERKRVPKKINIMFIQAKLIATTLGPYTDDRAWQHTPQRYHAL